MEGSTKGALGEERRGGWPCSFRGKSPSVLGNQPRVWQEPRRSRLVRVAPDSPHISVSRGLWHLGSFGPGLRPLGAPVGTPSRDLQALCPAGAGSPRTALRALGGHSRPPARGHGHRRRPLAARPCRSAHLQGGPWLAGSGAVSDKNVKAPFF